MIVVIGYFWSDSLYRLDQEEPLHKQKALEVYVLSVCVVISHPIASRLSTNALFAFVGVKVSFMSDDLKQV